MRTSSTSPAVDLGEVPTDAHDLAHLLQVEHGLPAYVLEPGPGTVHVATADGSVFLADEQGDHPDYTLVRPFRLVVGRTFTDGPNATQELWIGTDDNLAVAVAALIAQARGVLGEDEREAGRQ